MSFRSVLFPAPLRPMIPTRSPRSRTKSIERSAQNSRYSTECHGTNLVRPSASRRLSAFEPNILYIFPTPSRRIAGSDIVEKDALRAGEEPTAEPEARQGQSEHHQPLE